MKFACRWLGPGPGCDPVETSSFCVPFRSIFFSKSAWSWFCSFACLCSRSEVFEVLSTSVSFMNSVNSFSACEAATTAGN